MKMKINPRLIGAAVIWFVIVAVLTEFSFPSAWVSIAAILISGFLALKFLKVRPGAFLAFVAVTWVAISAIEILLGGTTLWSLLGPVVGAIVTPWFVN